MSQPADATLYTFPPPPPHEPSTLQHTSGARGRSSATRPVQHVADIQTGEVLRLVAPRGRPKHGEPFTMSFMGDMQKFTCSEAGRALTAVHWQVWTMVCSVMDFDNVMSLNVAQLARDLGRPRSVVSRAVTALENAGLVRRERDPRDPSRTLLSMNAHLVYRGSVQERRAAVVRQTWAPSGAQFASTSDVQLASTPDTPDGGHIGGTAEASRLPR